MKINDLLDLNLNDNFEVNDIKINSKEVKENDIFVCSSAFGYDRHDYIEDAVNNGAKFIITSKDININIPYLKVDDADLYLNKILNKFYDYPLNNIKLIGVTGTDGKTSTTTIIQTLIGKDICGYIGTNGYSYKDVIGETNNTTPDELTLFKIFNEFRNNGIKYVAMETSSEAFFYGRLKNFHFDIGAITNVDSEHLNTHKTLENYIDCKKQLFRQSGICIINTNMKYYSEFKDISPNSFTYGYKDSDLLINSFDIYPNKTDIKLSYEQKDYNITSPLLGKFNIENLSCAILTCLKLGINFNDLINNISKLSVDGRMMSINEGQNFYVLVDYAHTPNGLNRLFEFTNSLKVNKKIVVSGQAGKRDPYKRRIVGKTICDNNDLAIFTYEDPRTEDVKSIIDMMTQDIEDKSKYIIELDRHIAIEKAINLANENDLVMILGKGNENYQIIGDKEVPFSDVKEAISAIKKKLTK